MLRPDIITEYDGQTFDVVISKDKNAAFREKINKYKDCTFATQVSPIAMDYYFELHKASYNSLTKYMNGNVLRQILAFWLSSMICEQKKCYEIGAK